MVAARAYEMEKGISNESPSQFQQTRTPCKIIHELFT